MTTYPLHAIFLGGPPHSGKSTLVYRLSQALRRADIPHYVLRAHPDGEGDFLYTAPEAIVRTIRSKKEWTPEFAAWIVQLITDRHLPLLVDAGGLPSPENAMIAACCTRALLLSPANTSKNVADHAKNDANRKQWIDMLQPLGVPVIINVQSALSGEQVVAEQQNVLEGTITGLSKQASSDGIVFSRILDVLRPLFMKDATLLYEIHCRMASQSNILHLGEWHDTQFGPETGQNWQAPDVGVLNEYVTHQPPPWGLYGRVPIWAYGVAMAALDPAPHIFDVRYGWVAIPTSSFSEHPDTPDIGWEWEETAEYTHILCTIKKTHLDYPDLTEEGAPIAVPQLVMDRGIVLDGKLPNWLNGTLVRAYRAAPWVAMYYPQHHHAVVIASRVPEVTIGNTIAMPEIPQEG